MVLINPDCHDFIYSWLRKTYTETETMLNSKPLKNVADITDNEEMSG